MLTFIDISNHQGRAGLSDLSPLFPQCDAVIAKATEGTSLVDSWCDRYVQQCKSSGKPWGFYHFASGELPGLESDFFIKNCENYFHDGIPVLDWEGDQSVDWVNTFVRNVYRRTGIWPWIYANPWRFNQGGVEPNSMRWVASYPSVTSPTFEMAESWDCPTADGTVGAWQFCSDGRLSGYDGNLDLNLYYGNNESWYKYAGILSGNDSGESSGNNGDVSTSILENDEYKVTIERK